jgi:hypothetical protein
VRRGGVLRAAYLIRAAGLLPHDGVQRVLRAARPGIGSWQRSSKPLITEPTVSVNIKYGPQKEVQEFARFLMFSNHSAPLSIEEGDRRYFVVNSKATARDPRTLNSSIAKT